MSEANYVFVRSLATLLRVNAYTRPPRGKVVDMLDLASQVDGPKDMEQLDALTRPYYKTEVSPQRLYSKVTAVANALFSADCAQKHSCALALALGVPQAALETLYLMCFGEPWKPEPDYLPTDEELT